MLFYQTQMYWICLCFVKIWRRTWPKKLKKKIITLSIFQWVI